MLSNLLIHIVQEGGKEVPYFGGVDGSGWLGESLLYAFLGFFVTFLGIILLICIVWLCGKIVTRFSGWNKKKVAKVSVAHAEEEEDPVSDELRAAIIAAIAAYYDGESGTCEFQVKRIKRL